MPLCLFFCCGGKEFLVAQVGSLVVARKSFRCYYLTYHTSCAVVVSVIWLRQEIVFGYSVSKKDSCSVSLIERRTASKCVYFVRSNTLLLCVSLLSIYLLYQKFFSAFCEGIHLIPMLYPRKLSKFKETIVCESVEFSGKHSFTLNPSLDSY